MYGIFCEFRKSQCFLFKVDNKGMTLSEIYFYNRQSTGTPITSHLLVDSFSLTQNLNQQLLKSSNGKDKASIVFLYCFFLYELFTSLLVFGTDTFVEFMFRHKHHDLQFFVKKKHDTSYRNGTIYFQGTS